MNSYLEELKKNLSIILQELRDEFGQIRSNRPSVELVENIRVNCYNQWLSIKQLASLSILPPRGIQISVWDKNVVGAVAKAIEEAKIGFSTSVDGNIVRATLSPLGDERRAELTKLAKKTAEEARIKVRNRRDESIKKIKLDEGEGLLTEDQAFRIKEEIQKEVDKFNDEIEKLLEAKLKEINE